MKKLLLGMAFYASFSSLSFGQYCTPFFNFGTNQVMISDETFGSFNSFTFAFNDYVDSSGVIAQEVCQGQTGIFAQFTATDINFGIIDEAIYIDWNQNESFYDPGEMYFNFSNISVPAGAAPGVTRIRYVAVGEDDFMVPGFADPCGSFTNPGAAVDFSIRVLTATDSADISINASSTTICAGNNVMFTANPTHGGTPIYQWKLNGGNVGTNSPTYSNNSLSDGDQVTCEMTSSLTCLQNNPVTSNTVTMTVNSIPAAPTAGNNGPVCKGDQLDLTASNIAGATYSWSGPLAYSSSTQNPTVSASATTGMAGSYSVTATVAGCTGPAGNTSVAVNALPAAPTAGNNGPVCEGDQLDLTASNIAGATYSWTGPLAYSSSSQNPTVSASAIASMAGSYSVTATVAGCTGPAGSTNVTVNSTVVPSASIVVDINPISPGQTATFTATPISGGASPTYQWYVNNVAVGTNSNVYASNTLNDNDSVHVEMTSNATCASPTTVQSNAIYMGIITSNVASLNSDLNIFPNPFSESFTINSSVGNAAYVLEVYDLTGSLVYSTSGKVSTSSAISPPIPSGVYIGSIQIGDKETSIRIIKQ